MGARFLVTGGEDSAIRRYMNGEFGTLPDGDFFDMLVIYRKPASSTISESSLGIGRQEVTRKLDRLAPDFAVGNISEVYLYTQSSNLGHREGAD